MFIADGQPKKIKLHRSGMLSSRCDVASPGLGSLGDGHATNMPALTGFSCSCGDWPFDIARLRSRPRLTQHTATGILEAVFGKPA